MSLKTKNETVVLLVERDVSEEFLLELENSDAKYISLEPFRKKNTELVPNLEVEYLHVVGKSNENHGLCIAEIIDKEFRQCGDETVKIYANDCYLNIYRNVGAILDYIEKLETKNVKICTTVSEPYNFRRHMMQTIEFPQGSLNLFVETVLFLLSKYIISNTNIKIEYVGKKRQIYDPLLRLMKARKRDFVVVFSGLYLALKYREYAQCSYENDLARNAVICRTQKHIDMAGINHKELGCPIVLYFPQLLANKINFSIIPSGYLVAPSRTDLYLFFVKSLWSGYRHRKISRFNSNIGYSIGLVDFKLNPSDVANDLGLYTPLRMYRYYLDKVVNEIENIAGLKCIVSFEQFSRQSFVERDICDLYNLKYTAIQTVAIQSVRQHHFPISDIFYCDSEENSNSLSNIGHVKHGKTTYGGRLKSMVNVVPTNRCDDVVFFTQPYEHEINQKIITLISENLQSGKFLVKLHPRDEIGFYDTFSYNNVHLVEDTSASDLIASCKLIVARTSSVLGESVGVNKPVLACLFTELDKSSSESMDYLVDLRNEGLVAYDELSFLSMFMDFDYLSRRTDSLHNRRKGKVLSLRDM